ncbi:unnamed protein product [Orchesella dallaii]|uniref:Uncharacterized protein n=1 Tax=Orchesella dallaii TaxID=48710 RepID=A0ABP1R6B2_9HEXA
MQLPKEMFNKIYKQKSCTNSSSSKSDPCTCSSCENASEPEVEVTTVSSNPGTSMEIRTAGPSEHTSFAVAAGILNQPLRSTREEEPAAATGDAIVEDITTMEIAEENQPDRDPEEALPLAEATGEQFQLAEFVPEADYEVTVKMEVQDEIEVETEERGHPESFEYRQQHQQLQPQLNPWHWRPQHTPSTFSIEELVEPVDLSVTHLNPDPFYPTYSPSTVTKVPIMILDNLDPSLQTEGGDAFVPTNTIVITTPPGTLISSPQFIWPSPPRLAPTHHYQYYAGAPDISTSEQGKEGNGIPENNEEMEEDGDVPREEDNVPVGPLEQIHEYFNLLGDFVDDLHTKRAGEYSNTSVHGLFHAVNAAKILLHELGAK